MSMVAEFELRPDRRLSKRRRVSVVGVLGELLITAGVVVLLFLGWQLWFNDIIVSNDQKQTGDLVKERPATKPAPLVYCPSEFVDTDTPKFPGDRRELPDEE